MSTKDRLPKTRKPTVAFFAFRTFDMRQLLSTGIVAAVADSARVLLLVDDTLIDSVRAEVGEFAECRPVAYGTARSSKRNPFRSWPRLRLAIHRFLSDALKFTHGSGRRNVNRQPDIAAFRAWMRRGGLTRRLRASATVAFCSLLCRSRLLRRAVLLFGDIALVPSGYGLLFDEEHPSLVVCCSFERDDDVFFTREAHRHGIPVLTVVQSWDKTSTRGYPRTRSDYATVWSHVMVEELVQYHDMRCECVYVTGAPEWDSYFESGIDRDRAAFCQHYGLDPDRKIINLALSAKQNHEGDIEVMRLLFDGLKRGRFRQPSQLLVRVHPSYNVRDLCPIEVYRAVRDVLDELECHPLVGVDLPELLAEGPIPILAPEDANKLRLIFSHADVCVSVASTQMIEAAIFDKPAVSIEYGRTHPNALKGGAEIRKREHLERVYSTNAVLVARSPDELLAHINECLQAPEERRAERLALVDQELPVFRGAAAHQTARCIISLAMGEGLPDSENPAVLNNGAPLDEAELD